MSTLVIAKQYMYRFQMRLIPIRALDHPDTEWIKVADTKGCIVFATGTMRPTPTSGQAHCLCVAVKRQVYFDHTKDSHFILDTSLYR